MKNEIFEKAYDRLNPQQKQAVDTIDGPVIVLAGPGTGKTQVLATRIANILLKTDTPAYALLALTFTEAAAINMKERIVQLIGQQGHYVCVTTFHSFCSDTIKSYPEYFPIDPESEPLSDLESYEILNHLIDTLPLDILKPVNSEKFYIRTIRSLLSNLKREGVLPQDLQTKILEYEEMDTSSLSNKEQKDKQKLLQKNKELLLVYFAYQKELIRRKRFDYDDMISLTVESLKQNEELLLTLQEKYHYILVDEYQDTNSAQNDVVQLVANFWGEQANIFVVGDPHQSIFRFQGASLENVLQFTTVYPNATIISLTQGYRCPQEIYTAAHTLIQHNESTALVTLPTHELFNALNVQLTTDNSNHDSIQLVTTSTQQTEIIHLAHMIQKKIAAGVDPDDIAVLYRTNADGEEIEDVFAKLSIPYHRDKGQSLFEMLEIHQLLTLLRCIDAVSEPYNESSIPPEIFFEMLLYPWIPTSDLLAYQLAHIAGKSHGSKAIPDIIRDGYDMYVKKSENSHLTAIEFYQAEKLLSDIQNWATLCFNKTLIQWFEIVINESGFMEWCLQQPHSIELLRGLQTLFSYIKSRSISNHKISLSMLLDELTLMQSYGLTLQIPALAEMGGVTLSTVHSAKGKEWNYVYLIHCNDKKWGNTKSRELIKLIPGILTTNELLAKEQNEDERRLFYVAITRTKIQLTLLVPQAVQTAHSLRPLGPSMFLSEIEDYSTKHVTESETPKNEELALLLGPTNPQSLTGSLRAYLKSIIDDFVLTPTSLNRYLQSPHDFLYENLLRVPRSKPEHFSYGTAIHAALEHMYKGYIDNNNQRAPITEVLAIYKSTLSKEILTSPQYSRRLAHGETVLTSYYERSNDEISNPVYLETLFGSGLHRTFLDGIPLRGRIDRIDWIDKATNRVRVIDYKTGKQRSLNEIKGLTISSGLSEREMALPESIRGGYKRQLLFYKLLCQLSPLFNYEVEEGVFDFVEPDKTSGKFVQRVLELPQEDIEDLKNVIKDVIVEIRTLKFLEDLKI